MKPITEDKIEYFAIEQLQSLGWEYIHGSVISPEGEKPESENYKQIILTDRLRKTVSEINSNTNTTSGYSLTQVDEWRGVGEKCLNLDLQD
jgi:type I restriction enzyme R subunit